MMKEVFVIAVTVLAVGVQVVAARTQTKDVSTASGKANDVVARGGNDSSNEEEKVAPEKTGTKKAAASEKPAVTAAKAEKSDKDSKTDKSKEVAGTSAAATAAPAAGTPPGTPPANAEPAKTVAAVAPASASKANETAAKGSATASETPVLLPANIYRVGVGDVLDIRLLNQAASRESTLFTVMAGGLLEYPLAGDPIKVAGLTTDEIGERLASAIKIYEKPQVVVGVREYTSHSVIVTGLASDTGTKYIRREAVPLYVLLAEAQPRPEAARATIMRAGGQSITVDLSDPVSTSALVLPGDVIRLSAAPPPQPQFFYIGGQINAPGQKEFHAGLTLTQAVLASGGTTRFANGKVKVWRQSPDGLLVTTEYNLKQIEAGKIPDPQLQPGDRLEIGRGRW